MLTVIMLTLVAIFVIAVVIAAMSFMYGMQASHYDGEILYDDDDYFSDVQEAIKDGDNTVGGEQLKLWETGQMPVIDPRERPLPPIHTPLRNTSVKVGGGDSIPPEHREAYQRTLTTADLEAAHTPLTATDTPTSTSPAGATPTTPERLAAIRAELEWWLPAEALSVAPEPVQVAPELVALPPDPRDDVVAHLKHLGVPEAFTGQFDAIRDCQERPDLYADDWAAKQADAAVEWRVRTEIEWAREAAEDNARIRKELIEQGYLPADADEAA